MRLKIIFLCVVFFFTMGCTVDNGKDGTALQSEGKYGIMHFGEEQIPVNYVSVFDEVNMLLVLLSPMRADESLTTSAIIGLKTDFLGQEVDVEHLFCNDDYIVIYENAESYYAPFRPLKSGTITMKRGSNGVSIAVDVLLYDGTRLCYTNESLPIE